MLKKRLAMPHHDDSSFSTMRRLNERCQSLCHFPIMSLQQLSGLGLGHIQLLSLVSPKIINISFSLFIILV